MNPTRTSLQRPVAVVVLTVALLVTGFFSLKQLDVDYLPEVTYPLIKIHIWWRGATPDEVETNIGDPIERVLATVDNLDYLESSSIEGMYTLQVNFRYGTDVEVAYQDVITAMGQVSRNLPKDMDPPVIIKADPSQLPVMQVTLSSEVRDLVWLRDWADNWLSGRLVTVSGTAGVEVVGGLVREIRVEVDPLRLAAYGLSAEQVSAALAQENIETFAGRMTVGSREIIARTMGEFKSLAEMRRTIIKTGVAGQYVRLQDVANVYDGHEDMRVMTRFNGDTCVKLNVLKQAEANTVTVAAAVQEKLDHLRAQIPDDIQVNYVENQGNYVMGAIRSVETSALFAALLVILVVYLFLGRWRQVLVMVVALPATLLVNFFIMKLAGFSLNIFSLGGLVVALGVILDNSIVVLENITRLQADGVPDAELQGTAEVSSAITASTLTFLAIFLPFLFVPGLMSLLFRELVLVVASIVLVSLLVAITLTPLLTRRLTAGQVQQGSGNATNGFSRMVERMTVAYGAGLAVALRRKYWVLAITVVLFVAGLGLGKKVGSEFLPKVDDGRVMVKVKMPSGTSVETVDGILDKIRRQLQDLPEIESIFSLAGGKVWGLYTYEIANEGELDVQLRPKSRRSLSTAEFISKIKPLVGKVPAPGGKVPVMQMKVKGIRGVGEQDVEVKIKGNDLAAIFGFAKKVAAGLQKDERLKNVNVSMDMTKPEYQVVVDRERAQALGLSVHDVAGSLRALINGTVASRYRDGSDYYDIRLVMPESELSDKTRLDNLVVALRGEKPIYLKDVATIKRAVGPVEIVRDDQAKQVIVRADALGTNVGDATARAALSVGAIDLPVGIEWEMGGQADMMAENNRAMILIGGFAALFAYVVLAIQFDSFVLPLLILLVIPLALTGGFLGLFLGNIPVGVTVLIGFVIMMGGITSQGVVLLSLAEEYRQSGLSAREAVTRAAPLRLRPILMTQLTTILGLTPLALNLGEGGDMLMPMAVAVIGGLLFSLLLTMFVLPSLYLLSAKGN